MSGPHQEFSNIGRLEYCFWFNSFQCSHSVELPCNTIYIAVSTPTWECVKWLVKAQTLLLGVLQNLKSLFFISADKLKEALCQKNGLNQMEPNKFWDLVPNWNKLQLVIDWPHQIKWNQVKFWSALASAPTSALAGAKEASNSTELSCLVLSCCCFAVLFFVSDHKTYTCTQVSGTLHIWASNFVFLKIIGFWKFLPQNKKIFGLRTEGLFIGPPKKQVFFFVSFLLIVRRKP